MKIFILFISLFFTSESFYLSAEKGNTKKCEAHFTEKFGSQEGFEIVSSKTDGRKNLKLAFTDPDLDLHTKYVSSVRINVKDSTHYCSCYFDKKVSFLMNVFFHKVEISSSN